MLLMAMVALTPLDYIVAVGLSMALPLFAISARRCNGSPFNSVLVPLGVVLALGVATASVNLLSIGQWQRQSIRLVLVGAAAVFSVLGAYRLHRMSTGEWSA